MRKKWKKKIIMNIIIKIIQGLLQALPFAYYFQMADSVLNKL